jgi:hypothetical protein
MILQVDIPQSFFQFSADPDEVLNAWIWMAIQKTTLLPKWYVVERVDKPAITKEKIRFRRVVVTVVEGKPKGRSFLSADLPPLLVKMFCQCHEYEPEILEEVHNE